MRSYLRRRIVRASIPICLAMLLGAPAARAQNAAALAGVYNGTYRCAQGPTNLKLSLTVTAAGEVSGLFTFYLPPGTQNQGYTYSLHGLYDPRTAKFSLMPVRWETQHPATFNMVGLNGSFDSTELAGSVTGAGCSTFNVERNASESANIAAVMALQRSVAPPDGVAAAPPATRSANASPLPAAPARPAQQPPAQRPAPQAAPPRPAQAAATPGAPQSPIIENVCSSTDPNAPAYFSDIFEYPDEGSTASNFLNYEQAKLGFYIHLINTYKYAGSRDSVFCGYLSSTTTPNVAAAIAARKQTLQAQAAAAGKQVIETHWTYSRSATSPAASTAGAQARGSQPTRSGATGTSQQAASQAAQRQGTGTLSPEAQKAVDDLARSARDAEQAEKNVDRAFARVTGPILAWGMKTEKDALTDEVTTKPTATRYIPGADGKLQGYVTASAYCGSNGVSIFFLAGAGDKDPTPSFPWYVDNSRPDDQVADVRVRVDSRPVHVAQGFPEENNHQRYTNTIGLLFYDPGAFARAVRDQQDSVATGLPSLDGILGGLTRQAAQANAQAWQDSSAGPLADLVSTRSVRIELPVTTFDPKPVLDLNPQDPVLHKFVSDCSARFGGNGGRAR